MEPKNAQHRMKLTFTPGQNDKVSSFDPVVRDEEGLYGFFCTSCNASNPEEELDCALIADECLPASEELSPEQIIKIKPMRVLKHHPSAIVFTEDCIWCRGSIVIGNGLPSNANIFIFNGPAQLKHRPRGEWERRDDQAWQIEHHRPELKRDQCVLPCESSGARRSMWSHNHPDSDEVETWPCCVCYTLLEDKRDTEKVERNPFKSVVPKLGFTKRYRWFSGKIPYWRTELSLKTSSAAQSPRTSMN